MRRLISKVAAVIDRTLLAVGIVLVLPFLLVTKFPIDALREWIERRWPDSERARAVSFWIGLLAPFVLILVLLVALGVAIQFTIGTGLAWLCAQKIRGRSFFRGAVYLRLPLVTTLAAADGGSQYRIAALAFDRHVSHLVRGVLPYLKGSVGIDGIAFRTTVNVGASPAPESVEFLFTLGELRRYENYDITGQQLIDGGFVLINGERVGLDLQTAESIKP